MSELQTLEQKVEAAVESLKAKAAEIIAKAHAEVDALLGIEHKDAVKAETVVDTVVAEVKETEAEVKSL
jgi:hypothetical protein